MTDRAVPLSEKGVPVRARTTLASAWRALTQRLDGWSPARVAALVLAVHLVWILAFFATGHEIRDFVRIGVKFVTESDVSDTIRFDPDYEYPKNQDPDRTGEGYDGQFSYFLALDPANAHHYMDLDGYRYLRPLYPALARALSLGQPDLVPWALLLVNLAAMGVAAFAAAKWLERRGHPPWLALLFALSPGLLVAVQRDLTEPLSYALVAVAMLLFDRGPRGWLASAGVLALATLARQTAGLFSVPLALGLLLSGEGPLKQRALANWRRTVGFLAVSIVPYIAYYVVITLWLGDTDTDQNFTAVPLGGSFDSGIVFEAKRHGVSLITVGVPVLIWLMLAAKLLRERALAAGSIAWVAALAVIFNALVLVVFYAGNNTYTAAGRSAAGVALAVVFLLPALRASGMASRPAFIWSAVLWLVMLPVVAVYGLEVSA